MKNKNRKTEHTLSESCMQKFKRLDINERIMLKDDRSSVKARVPIKAVSANVYYASPETDIISENVPTKKADYAVICVNEKIQTSFIELKGQNISSNEDDSPFEQIICTIDYFTSVDELKVLVSQNAEKHAFIASPLRQRIPAYISLAERKLLILLGTRNKKNKSNSEYLHYVRFLQKGKYSDKNGRITCSSDSPLEFPYRK